MTILPLGRHTVAQRSDKTLKVYMYQQAAQHRRGMEGDFVSDVEDRLISLTQLEL